VQSLLSTVTLLVFLRNVHSRKGRREIISGYDQKWKRYTDVTGESEAIIFISLRGDILRFTVVTLLACLAASNSAVGQWMGKQTGCYADSIVANPNRPTVANPADITQYGVLELEYGWDRQWPEEGRQQASVGGLLKFGMLCDVELRWNTTSFLSQTDASGTHRSFGDNWLGPQIRVYRQTERVPTLAFGYAVKIPSASTEDGLGTGHVDHAFTILASKDIARVHFDFNVTQFLIGRPNTYGLTRISN